MAEGISADAGDARWEGDAVAERRLLLVDDELLYAKSLRAHLRSRTSWSLDWCPTATDALEAIAWQRYDLVLLDPRLGGSSTGFDVCREMRREGRREPVVVVSGDDSISSRLRAFEVRADDHVGKELGPEELLLRMRVALVRGHVSPIYEFRDVLADTRTRAVYIRDRSIDLTDHHFAMLVRMMDQIDEAIPHRELCRVGRIQRGAGWDNLRDAIRHLRERLGDAGELIRTVRGRGYGVFR